MKLLFLLISITLSQGPLYHPGPAGTYTTVRKVINTSTLIVRIPGYDSQIPVRQYNMKSSINVASKQAVLAAVLDCDGVVLWNLWWDDEGQMLWADIYVCGVKLSNITEGAEWAGH